MARLSPFRASERDTDENKKASLEEEDCQVRIEKSSEIECSKCMYMDMNISIKFSVINYREIFQG